MQPVSISGAYSHLPLSEDPNKTALSGRDPAEEQLHNMPAPARINELQWNLASPQERRTLLAAELDQEPAKDNASSHSFPGIKSIADVFALLHRPPAFSTDGWDREQHGDNLVYNPTAKPF